VLGHIAEFMRVPLAVIERGYAERPDRFLEDPRGMRDLIGFGGGVHRCLGVHFAYLEMKVIITLLLQRYRLELIDPDPQPIPGQKTKWPQSPRRVRHQALATGSPAPQAPEGPRP
jgi:cytochrome P450